MDIKKLKAFAMVAEFGSFSRAAAVLGVVQPMLSRQVRALEEELGVAARASQRPRHRADRGRQPAQRIRQGHPRHAGARRVRGRRAAVEPTRQRGDRHAAVDGLRADGAADPALSQRAPVHQHARHRGLQRLPAGVAADRQDRRRRALQRAAHQEPAVGAAAGRGAVPDRRGQRPFRAAARADQGQAAGRAAADPAEPAARACAC